MWWPHIQVEIAGAMGLLDTAWERMAWQAALRQSSSVHVDDPWWALHRERARAEKVESDEEYRARRREQVNAAGRAMRARRKAAKGWRRPACTRCGVAGHNSRTCAEARRG